MIQQETLDIILQDLLAETVVRFLKENPADLLHGQMNAAGIDIPDNQAAHHNRQNGK